jgi:hypothetical protein
MAGSPKPIGARQNPLALANAYRWLAISYRRLSKTHRRPATTHRTPPNCFAVSPKPMAAARNLVAGRLPLMVTRQWLSARRRYLTAAHQCLALAPRNVFSRGNGFRRGSETFQGAGRTVAGRLDGPSGSPEAFAGQAEELFRDGNPFRQEPDGHGRHGKRERDEVHASLGLTALAMAVSM